MEEKIDYKIDCSKMTKKRLIILVSVICVAFLIALIILGLVIFLCLWVPKGDLRKVKKAIRQTKSYADEHGHVFDYNLAFEGAFKEQLDCLIYPHGDDHLVLYKDKFFIINGRDGEVKQTDSVSMNNFNDVNGMIKSDLKEGDIVYTKGYNEE